MRSFTNGSVTISQGLLTPPSSPKSKRSGLYNEPKLSNIPKDIFSSFKGTRGIHQVDQCPGTAQVRFSSWSSTASDENLNQNLHGSADGVENRAKRTTSYRNNSSLRLCLEGRIPQCDGLTDNDIDIIDLKAPDLLDTDDQTSSEYQSFYGGEASQVGSAQRAITPNSSFVNRHRDPSNSRSSDGASSSDFNQNCIGTTLDRTLLAPERIQPEIVSDSLQARCSVRDIPNPVSRGSRKLPLRPSQLAPTTVSTSPICTAFSIPDRFIPIRRSPNSPSSPTDTFYMSKSPNQLTEGERHHRSVSASPNPFGPSPRKVNRLDSRLRSLREWRARLTPVSGISPTSSSRGSLNRGSLAESPRQVSIGAVWRVGGTVSMSDSMFGIPTGRGGVLGSGTNAPLYTSMFFRRPDPESELDTYERRLALALDVDHASKVLGSTSSRFPNLSSGVFPEPSGKHLSFASLRRPEWIDNQWIQRGSICCSC
jgi:hypothetical protein